MATTSNESGENIDDTERRKQIESVCISQVVIPVYILQSNAAAASGGLPWPKIQADENQYKQAKRPGHAPSRS